MIVGDLSRAELRQRLTGAGLRVRVGPIIAEIRSSFAIVQRDIGLHYAAHDLVTPDEFADFHLSVEHARGVRRLLKPQAVFRFDGTSPFKPLATNQAYALLEWGINWSIATHCHQYLIVHAAVVERRGCALVLPSPPGSGKSTLCAALVARGWRLLSDELTVIDIATGCVVPFPRPISLKNESIDAIEVFWPEAAMSPPVHETLKGTVTYVRPPVESVRAGIRNAKPRWIAIPRYAKDRPTELVKLSKAAAFMQLVDNAFNYSVHGRRGFDLLTDIADSSDSFEFTYGGALDEAVHLFDDLARQP